MRTGSVSAFPLLAVALAALVLCLPACQMNERLSGTVFGGTAGGVIGALGAESVGGALIGGLGGALIGYLVGDYLADQRERGSAQLSAAPYAPSGPAAGGAGVGGIVTTPAVMRTTSPSEAALARGREALTAPEAQAAYREAIQTDPRNADAWNALGLSLLSSGRPQEAEACFRRALDVEPSHYAAGQNLRWVQSGIR